MSANKITDNRSILPLGDGTASPGNDEQGLNGFSVFKAGVTVACLILATIIVAWAVLARACGGN